MIRTLVQLIAEFAITLELADESMISLDTATQMQEEMAFRLQSLTPDERSKFLSALASIAEEETAPGRKAILERLPGDCGLI
jgi:hypothetical protein